MLLDKGGNVCSNSTGGICKFVNRHSSIVNSFWVAPSIAACGCRVALWFALLIILLVASERGSRLSLPGRRLGRASADGWNNTTPAAIAQALRFHLKA